MRLQRCRTPRRKSPSPFRCFPPSVRLPNLPLKSPSSVPSSVQSKASITSKLSYRYFLFSQFHSSSSLSFLFVNQFRIAENDFFKQDWRARSKVQIFQYVFMKWMLCFFIGVIVSLIGFANNLAVENLAGVKFVITSNMMLAGRCDSPFSPNFSLLFCFAIALSYGVCYKIVFTGLVWAFSSSLLPTWPSLFLRRPSLLLSRLLRLVPVYRKLRPI